MPDDLDLEVAELLEDLATRDLDATPFPVVHLGTHHVKRRRFGRSVPRAVVMATGVERSGEVEPIGVAFGDPEDAAFWRTFLLSLVARRLRGVELVAVGDHEAALAAVQEVFRSAV
ncbi:MAG TPA: transposase, partial [Acidimicrobiia bacterium]|nr:transposase [Acidimicrobiia bacterium]